MSYAGEMRRCLEEVDITAARRLWAKLAPNCPQPESDGEVLATIHYARTRTVTLPKRARFYSHRWLEDHNLPSGLPDAMRPPAERMYPRSESAVGISYNARSSLLKSVTDHVRSAMEYAVLDAYADGNQDDHSFIRLRMNEARLRTLKKLLGLRL